MKSKAIVLHKCLALSMISQLFIALPALSIDRKSEPNAIGETPQIKALDRDLRDFLNRWAVPGVSITISYKGKVVLSRGIGIADWSTHELVSPKHIFRIASLSKSITAVGILLLYQQGKLDLEQKAFEILKDIKPCDPTVKVDPRIATMTIRNLLECTSGWNQDLHGDPIFGNVLADSATNCSRSLRPSVNSMIRYLLNDRLDFTPGTDYAYSNVSYVVLGKIIEKVSGMSYGDFITKNVFEPMKIDGIKLGGTLESQRMPDEVRYYVDGDEEGNSLLPNVRGPLSTAYGGYFLLEAAPGSIGWTARPEDLIKFINIICGDSEIPSPLNLKTSALMLERPIVDFWKSDTEYFAKGWEVSKDEKGRLLYFSRHGSLPGLMSLVEHQSNGISWAANFNFRPRAYTSSREEVKQIIKSSLESLLPTLQAKYGK